MITHEFNDCVKRKKLIRFPSAKKLCEKELNIAILDLESSKDSLKKKNYKWATVQAYYAMFHAARTLLFHKGYREKSHYCLILAIKYFYIKEGLIDINLIENMQMAKIMRENADYENAFDGKTAELLVENSENFVNIAKGIILNK